MDPIPPPPFPHLRLSGGLVALLLIQHPASSSASASSSAASSASSVIVFRGVGLCRVVAGHAVSCGGATLSSSSSVWIPLSAPIFSYALPLSISLSVSGYSSKPATDDLSQEDVGALKQWAVSIGHAGLLKSPVDSKSTSEHPSTLLLFRPHPDVNWLGSRFHGSQLELSSSFGGDRSSSVVIIGQGFSLCTLTPTTTTTASHPACLTIPDDWSSFLATYSTKEVLHPPPPSSSRMTPPIAVICGKRGAGKSTLCRLLCNSWCSTLAALALSGAAVAGVVAVLDCDVGQPLMTAPGLVSLSLVSSDAPLLGEGLCRTPRRSFFLGAASPRAVPQLWIAAICSLLDFYRNSYQPAGIPLLCNTPGWTVALGGSLLERLISECDPSILVCLVGSPPTPSTTTQEPPPPSPDSLLGLSLSPRGAFSFFLLLFYLCADILPHSIHDFFISKFCVLVRECAVSLNSAQFNPPVRSLSASERRALQLVLYLEQPGGGGSGVMIPLWRRVPYMVSWSMVQVFISLEHSPPSEALVVLNASVVGLLTRKRSAPTQTHTQPEEQRPGALVLLSTQPLAPCLGMGVVRGLDPLRRLLFILSPLPLEIIQQVDTIVKGSLELPAVLLLQDQPSPPSSSSSSSASSSVTTTSSFSDSSSADNDPDTSSLTPPQHQHPSQRHVSSPYLVTGVTGMGNRPLASIQRRDLEHPPHTAAAHHHQQLP